MSEETEIIKSAQARAATIVAEAKIQRELILSGIGSMEDIRNRIKKFCLSEDQYSMMRHSAERIDDPALYTSAIKEIKRELSEINALPGGATTYERNSSIQPFGLAYICELATDYFELLFDGLVKNVLSHGLERSKYEMMRLQESVELTMSLGTKMKFKDEYILLKMEELELNYKRELAKEREREARKAEADRQREEFRAQKEYERELDRAQKDEKAARDALKRARLRADIEAEGSAERNRLQAKIEKLEQALREAQSRAERAQSMAQQTRCGYVYVISNIGSFGEGVYKIGMTRRLDPMERVTELGDASVPFPFDVHAMIYSEDAPGLEAALHRAFERKKLNMVNGRKEFFRVSLEEIKRLVLESGIDAEFLDEPMAQQWRDSQMFAEMR